MAESTYLAFATPKVDLCEILLIKQQAKAHDIYTNIAELHEVQEPIRDKHDSYWSQSQDDYHKSK